MNQDKTFLTMIKTHLTFRRLKSWLTKKRLIAIGACLLLVVAGCLAWKTWASATKIAFLNYQAINLGQIAKANNSSHIKIAELDPEHLDKASGYDFIFVNGMGLRLTDEQRAQLDKVAERVPVLTTAATNPENNILSVDSLDAEYIKQYLTGGGKMNYRSMLEYVRKFVDGKRLFAPTPADPSVGPSGLFSHADVSSKDEEVYFDSLQEYMEWQKKHGLYKEGAPGIIVTGQMGVTDSLIYRLEQSGNNVFQVSSLNRLIAMGTADSIPANAVINLAHGRLGDDVVKWLSAKNIPLFSPVNANRDIEEWEADKMGMNGGFLSQSVVTPEIDGAVRPYTLFAHYKGEDGLPYVAAIPDRLRDFVATVNNYLSLQRKANAEKRVAIFYFKGPGQNALVAEGMEVAPSLYNLLTRLKSEGYKVEGLPADAKGLEALIAERGKVFNNYAVGASADFVKSVKPRLIDKRSYDEWSRLSLPEKLRQAADSVDGVFPGHGLHDDKGNLALASLEFGNVVLIPQTAAGIGDDDFKIVHGTDQAPPHAYIASYLWAQHGFKADALIHFGAHGSLEFTPRKQAALGSEDWPDRLVGTMPHFYIYSTSNVGEAMMAKRRSYAGIINYLTPPFMESNLRGVYRKLSDAIQEYDRLAGADSPSTKALDEASRKVKKLAVELGIHRELRLDSVLSRPYSPDDIARIETFAEELASEKIVGALYVMGRPYSEEHQRSTVLAMTVDPLAYSLYSLDKRNGRTKIDYERQRALFSSKYQQPAKAMIEKMLASGTALTDAEIAGLAGISMADLSKARKIDSAVNSSKDMLSRMMVMGSMMSPKVPTLKIADRRKGGHSMMKIPGMSQEKALEMARKMGADEEAIKKMKAAMSGKKGGSADAKKSPHAKKGGMNFGASQYTPDEIEKATAIMEVERALNKVREYKTALASSPEEELNSVVNALSGHYIPPTSGGDPIINPLVLPTGRNLFAVNAEETPSESAWEKGKSQVKSTIKMYRKAHNDSLPRKVSYTLWSSEFIETEGATIAQVLYMLGVEPVRDPFGRVTDLRLIPSEELGRPRIDVVVQTSGQLRDLAASRLFLIDRAVKMAAAADKDKYPNYVREGVTRSEEHLVKKGVTPKEARELSTARVFGGVNGNYGSGIQEMVEAGDRWEKENEIAETYMNNMGAIYTSEDDWERDREFAFEAALTGTDVVVQPRQSNTWGALSLDHVYEFMGGMNLAVRNVTGKDPDAYMSDYRNRNHTRMQEVKEAIGVESRATILNPEYIREHIKGGAGDASAIADVVRNTYGWNVMKPDVIDNELWDDIYDTYVKDKHSLGTREYFKDKNPAALQEITAVMLESSRKGLWKASPDKIKELSELHTQLIKEHGAACSKFVCDNAKLKDYISKQVDEASAAEYKGSISSVRAEKASENDGMVMKKETLNEQKTKTAKVAGAVVAAVVVVALFLIILVIIKKRRNATKK